MKMTSNPLIVALVALLAIVAATGIVAWAAEPVPASSSSSSTYTATLEALEADHNLISEYEMLVFDGVDPAIILHMVRSDDRLFDETRGVLVVAVRRVRTRVDLGAQILQAVYEDVPPLRVQHRAACGVCPVLNPRRGT